ncbi:MAG: hypothetical protein HOP12_15335 [Candidatus Eisenbacteria bacterium]|uniref:Glycoside hydrolase family 13 N-terminal domain-containing protein n=1 Tax=Eiseniibacteriota bacterium TaxID=2212470 RepID=A0A849SRA6_UNCEI|nr:hypothetical protein [Candidatus Eisenbacteria bacterium]
MGRLLACLAIALAAVAMVLALAKRERPATATNYGVRVRSERARFVFSPRRYRWTTYGATGDSIRMNELRVRRVSLVGSFNDWDPDAWPMKRDEGTWELKRSLDSLGDPDSVAFTFVVNGRFWVEAPLEAANRRALAPGRAALALPVATRSWGAHP